MFTGIIEEIGSVKTIERSGEGYILRIAAQLVLEDMRKGDSLCINGACQTVTAIGSGTLDVYVSPVTASLTTLGDRTAGRRVNLERAMTHDSRFGGHIVQGHVDDTGKISSIERDQRGSTVGISVEKDLLKYVVARGSVAVDGISLTVVSLSPDGFTLHIIPETLERTMAGDWKTGERVNIEVDILAKYVESMLHNMKDEGSDAKNSKLKEKLMEEGFM